MKKLILGGAIAAGFGLAIAPTLSFAEPVAGCSHNWDWGDGDTGGCVLGGGGDGIGGAGGGGAGGASCFKHAGDNASCEPMALGYFYSSCTYNCRQT